MIKVVHINKKHRENLINRFLYVFLLLITPLFLQVIKVLIKTLLVHLRIGCVK